MKWSCAQIYERASLRCHLTAVSPSSEKKKSRPAQEGADRLSSLLLRPEPESRGQSGSGDDRACRTTCRRISDAHSESFNEASESGPSSAFRRALRIRAH